MYSLRCVLCMFHYLVCHKVVLDVVAALISTGHEVSTLLFGESAVSHHSPGRVNVQRGDFPIANMAGDYCLAYVHICFGVVCISPALLIAPSSCCVLKSTQIHSDADVSQQNE